MPRPRRDSWDRPLPSPGTMVLVNVPELAGEPGLYVEHLPSVHDRRVRYGHVLIKGSLLVLSLNYISPLPSV